jgi:hypothetical protein
MCLRIYATMCPEKQMLQASNGESLPDNVIP